MDMLTQELIQKFKETGQQITSDNPYVITKFYCLRGDIRRYATEYYPEANAYYGYLVTDGIGKWTYFALPKIEGMGQTNNLMIQRDLDFVPSFFDKLDL